MIGEIVMGQGEEVVDMRGLSRASRFCIQFQRVLQLPTLRGHVTEFKQGCTEIARTVGEAVGGDRFLQVTFGSSKIASLHCQRCAKEPVSSRSEERREGKSVDLGGRRII